MIKEYHEKVYDIKVSKDESIHGVYNYIDKDNPLIIITPQFEKTIRTNLTPMIYLINNGFNVFRYDNRYHNGNSTGDIEGYKSSQVIEDIGSVMAFIKSNEEIVINNGIGLLGISISNRNILRYLSQSSHEIDVLVSLVGVVNMQYTIKQILEFDLVLDKLNNPDKEYGIRKVLHYPINWDAFLTDLIDESLHSLESTKEDINRINIPIYLLVSEDDKWIDINEYDAVFKENSEILKGMYKLPNAGHELYKNPQAAEYALEKIVEIFNEFYGNKKELEVIKPKVTELISLNKRERIRERAFV